MMILSFFTSVVFKQFSFSSAILMIDVIHFMMRSLSAWRQKYYDRSYFDRYWRFACLDLPPGSDHLALRGPGVQFGEW